MRFREIIGEICDPATAAKEAQRRRDRESKARRDIAAAAERKADAKFGSNFVWSAGVPEKEATFGFTTFVDALMFALWAPSARLSAS